MAKLVRKKEGVGEGPITWGPSDMKRSRSKCKCHVASLVPSI